MIYLDNNATTAPHQDVVKYMNELMKKPLNPSSIHKLGRNAKNVIETARMQIKDIVNIGKHSRDYRVIFTASGTEANNLIISNFTDADIIVCATEHLSILAQQEKVSSFKLAEVNQDGVIKLDHLRYLLKQTTATKKLVSVMLANNETGVIQPLKEIVKIAKNYGALVHSDLVQAVGKMPVNMVDMDLDFATISGHKFGGAVGAAALIMKTVHNLEPMLIGGKQESGMRAGTENVIAIAGFGLAAEIAKCELKQRITHMRLLQQKLENGLHNLFPQIVIFGEKATRLPNSSLIALPNTSASLQIIALDLRDIAVSSGAACSSGKVSKSHVLKSMRIDENIAKGAVRISVSYNNSEQDIDHFINTFKEINENYERAC